MNADKTKPASPFAVSLRFWHPTIPSGEITRALGRVPSRCWDVGGDRRDSAGRLLVGAYDQSYWLLQISGSPACDLVELVRQDVIKLQGHERFLRTFVASGGRVEYFIGCFETQGHEFDWELLTQLSKLRINLSMDLYGLSPVDRYIEAAPEIVRPHLEKVRVTIRKALPQAEEVISYGMPAYRLPEGLVIFFAGWKGHYAIYPGNGGFVAEMRDELAACEVSKGTIKFPLDRPVPVRLIAKIAKLRAAEVVAKAAAKKKVTKKRAK